MYLIRARIRIYFSMNTIRTQTLIVRWRECNHCAGAVPPFEITFQ